MTGSEVKLQSDLMSAEDAQLLLPKLTDEQLATLKSYGTTEKTSIGQVLATAGDLTYDLMVVLEGEVECSDIHDGRRRALLVHGSRDFIAELDLMTGKLLYANFVVIEAGSIIRVPRSPVKAIIETEVTLGELLVQTLFRRREALLLLRSGIPNTTRDAGFEKAAGTTIVNSTRASSPTNSHFGVGGWWPGNRPSTQDKTGRCETVTNNQPDLADTVGSGDQAGDRPVGQASGGMWLELAAVLRGQVVTAADPGWDDARQPWDLVDQRPAVVVMPLDADDVRAVVVFARRHGLRVAPQGTGHNAGPLGPLEGTILLSTRYMRGIDIDPWRRTARVEAGVLWVEVIEAASPYGLFPLSGSSPNVGVVGYTLGGGLSWLGRKHGLAANHVTAIEVVTADGRLQRATSADHPDLFWALRGGGGNFGVVTALEFTLFPYGAVYAGMFVWPYPRHLEVVKAWHTWTQSASEAITTSFRVMHFPPLPDLPAFVSGRSVVIIDGVYAGDAHAGRAAVADLRALAPETDTWAMTSPLGLSRLHLDPEKAVPARSTSALLDDVEPGCYEAVAAATQPPLAWGEIRHLGGALARSPAGAGSLGSLRGEYLAFGAGILADSNQRDLATALDRFRDALTPYDNGTLYYNFSEAPANSARFYPDDAYARLRHLRAEVDPDGLIVANHPIPATQEGR